MLNKGTWVLNSMAPLGFGMAFCYGYFLAFLGMDMVRKTGGRGYNGVGGVLPDTIVLERLGDSVCYIEFLLC